MRCEGVRREEKRREGKGREGKGREGKRREVKESEGKRSSFRSCGIDVLRSLSFHGDGGPRELIGGIK